MPYSAAPSPARPVLADALPGARVRDVALVVTGALFAAACAQISIKLPGSPVPLTGQTFAVVLVGAGLGARRGGLAMILYVVLGLFLPVYASGEQGTGILFGAPGGYLFGFVLAAYAMGFVAERGGDRRFVTAIAADQDSEASTFSHGTPIPKMSSWPTAKATIAVTKRRSPPRSATRPIAQAASTKPNR
jgi:biotin transport system substrate-specific component